MNRSFAVPVAAAATALLAAGPAHAASTETSTLGGFHVTLTDLDPSDGVAPSVTLDPQSRSIVSASAVPTSGGASWIQMGDSAFGPVTVSGDLDGSGGSASFAGDPFGAGAQLVASATGGPSLAVGTSAAYVQTPPTYETQFLLSAHTQVTLWGATTIDWNAGAPGGSAFGEIDLALWLPDASGRDFVAQDDATGGYYGDGTGALSGSMPGGVMVTYADDSDAAIPVGYEVSVFATAGELEPVPPPIDEPAGAGLLLAGLSLLWRVRRRR